MSWIDILMGDVKTYGPTIISMLYEKNQHDAAKSLLLDPQFDPSCQDNYGIKWASYNGFSDTVEALLKYPEVNPCSSKIALKVDPCGDFSGWGWWENTCVYLPEPRLSPDYSAIELASMQGHIEIVKILLQDKRVDPTARGHKSLFLACKYGHTDVVKLLINRYIGTEINSEEINQTIVVSSQHGHTETVKLLLQYECIDPAFEDNSPFISACKGGHPETVKLLLQDERVDPAAQDDNAIGWACQNGNSRVVEILLQDKRVNPSTRDHLPILRAFCSLKRTVVRVMLQNGVDGRRLSDITSLTLGHVKFLVELKLPYIDLSGHFIDACRDGHEDIVKFLLQQEDIDIGASRGIRAAEEKRHFNIVKMILEHPLTKPNYSIFIYAMKYGFPNLAKKIMYQFEFPKKYYPDEGERRGNGIKEASKYGHVELVDLMLKDGRFNPGYNRNEAIQAASKNGHADVVRRLLTDPRTDPTDPKLYSRCELTDPQQAIKFAIEGDHFEVIKVLLDDPRVDLSYVVEMSINAVRNFPETKIGLLLLTDPMIRSRTNKRRYSWGYSYYNECIDCYRDSIYITYKFLQDNITEKNIVKRIIRMAFNRGI